MTLVEVKMEQPTTSLQDLLPIPLFKALADPNRVAILMALVPSASARSVSEIAQHCPTDMSVVSRHLKILQEAGLLQSQKKGRTVHYQLRVTHFVNLLRNLADALESCCPDGCTIQDDHLT